MKATPLMARGMAQCQRRSPRLMELQPMPSIAAAVGTYRMPESSASLDVCHACVARTWDGVTLTQS